MLNVSSFAQRLVAASAMTVAVMLTGCGGGGSADVVVVAAPPPVTALGIVLTRTGPERVQVDWSDDPYVATFRVSRDGFPLANVSSTTTLIDASVVFDQTYCYFVDGYDAAGNLIAQSHEACITIVF